MTGRIILPIAGISYICRLEGDQVTPLTPLPGSKNARCFPCYASGRVAVVDSNRKRIGLFELIDQAPWVQEILAFSTLPGSCVAHAALPLEGGLLVGGHAKTAEALWWRHPQQTVGQWVPIDLPPAIRKPGKAIDGLHRGGRQLIAVDDIVTPKWLVIYQLEHGSSFAQKRLVELPSHDSYERVVESFLGSQRPFVLDGDHLYLLRNHRAEVDVARALRARRGAAREPQRPITDDDLRALFNGSWLDAEERQRAAVRQAAGRRLMVLTGGPGTGKTTTVLRMLLGMSRDHAAVTGRLPQLRIAAPTGKAAQRLAESLRQGAERLRGGAQPLDSEWIPHLGAVLAADAATVHRLLGSRGSHGGYAFHAGEPLPADIVVVDEASMLDLGMLRALLAALPEDAVLVLVGDADQLTSVGTGSVMMDVVQALEDDPRGDLVRLSHCFRADASLVPINEAVRAGDAVAFDAAMTAASMHVVPDVATLRRRLASWARGLQAALADVGIATPVAADDAPALTQRLSVLRRHQLLCALREGPFGALQAADLIAARLRSWDALAPWSDGAWYPGRSVLVTRNDQTAQLYNGDVGVCVLVANGGGQPLLQVAFERVPDAATAGGVRLLDPNTLPPHEDAFALTVHKSQGSEYDRVAVLLPPDSSSPLLVRQMLYTAISRAKTSLELWAIRDIAERALSTTLARHGRLALRIRQSNSSEVRPPEPSRTCVAAPAAPSPDTVARTACSSRASLPA